MTSKTETRTWSKEFDLPHPPAKVWRALTEPDLLAAWLMPNDMRPTVGQRFQFRSEPTQWWDGIVDCEVLEVELHKRLRYAWRSASGTSPLDTVVTWTLTPTPSGTRLTLEHAGFKPTDTFAFDGMTQGWTRMVSQGMAGVLAKLA